MKMSVNGSVVMAAQDALDPSVVKYLPPLPVIEGTYEAAEVALVAAEAAEVAAEDADVAAEV